MKQTSPLIPAVVSTVPAEPISQWDTRAILIGLMVPMGMTVLNLSMFGVAVPSIRSNFGIQADQVAWLVTAYTLPFVIFMPLYGRLGDSLGKRRLFLVGIVIFFIGTLLALLTNQLPTLILGRIIQGIGTAGVNPLCIAMISDLFPAQERGKAFGTWSSTGPAAGMIAPFLGGFLVEQWGWWAIFVPGLLAAIISLYVVRERLPDMAALTRPVPLRQFDWLGMLLFSATMITLIFYLSSRPITGVEPLQDWRLLLGTLLGLAAFFTWERRHPAPLIDLSLFARRNFGRASLCALIRMYLMSSEGFLFPLYFTDIHHLSAGKIGLLFSLYAGSLLVTTRWAGKWADRGRSRWLIAGGLTLQASMMAIFTFLPGEIPVLFPATALIMHGLGAGFSLAVLSHTAMSDIPVLQSGSAAGLFSTLRFGGSILGATVGGVILQQALQRMPTALDAYQVVFVSIALVGFTGVMLAWKLR